MDVPQKGIRSFVIRAARLSPSQKKALEQLYPLYGVSFPPLPEWSSMFPQEGKRIVEIGYGNGEATLEIAQEHPELNILGIEVHPPGVGQVLREIGARGLNNLRLLRFDAVEVIKTMADSSVDGIHIFFPDPWPKKKHHKRRLLKLPFLLDLIRILRPNAYLYIATDWEEYAVEILETLNSIKGINNPYHGWASPITWRPRTKFETRGLQENRIIREIYIEKELPCDK